MIFGIGYFTVLFEIFTFVMCVKITESLRSAPRLLSDICNKILRENSLEELSNYSYCTINNSPYRLHYSWIWIIFRYEKCILLFSFDCVFWEADVLHASKPYYISLQYCTRRNNNFILLLFGLLFYTQSNVCIPLHHYSNFVVRDFI